MIRYTKSYNKEIRDAVHHAKSVEKTLSRRGIKLGIAIPKVSELKSKYQTRRELNKELTLLKKLSSSNDSVLRRIETTGGATAIKWEYDYLKQNAQNAIDYFKWEKKLELEKDPKYPHEMSRIYELDANIDYLEREVDYMNQDQFKAYKGAIREYTQIIEQMQRGYRGFLYQIETALRTTGFPDDQINQIFDKLKALNPSEFHEWYNRNDFVKRIYEIVPSPIYGDNKLNTSEEDAKEILDSLIQSMDMDIAEIKSK